MGDTPSATGTTHVHLAGRSHPGASSSTTQPSVRLLGIPSPVAGAEAAPAGEPRKRDKGRLPFGIGGVWRGLGGVWGGGGGVWEVWAGGEFGGGEFGGGGGCLLVGPCEFRSNW